MKQTREKFTCLATNWAPAGVLALVCRVLHTGRDEAVAAEQVALQPLVCEEPELTFLAVKRGSVVDHLRVDLNLWRKLFFK